MQNNNTLTLQLFIEHAREGTYFTLPFTMPPDTASFSLTYRYERQRESEEGMENGRFAARQKVNIIDRG